MKYLYYADMVLAPIAAILLLEYRLITAGMDMSLVCLVFAGIVFWSFAEYAIHRALHVYRIKSHMRHHTHPKEQSGPGLLNTILIMSAVYGFLFLAIGAENAAPLDAGILLGYGIYLYLHNLVHFSKFLPGNWARANHERHHKRPNEKFGVITGVWDRIFGTP
jgi:sterol desaturase/sphingolipid hydroxylase (fatty acid hydroxylase superfamily)